jgi:hypothetical protein
MRNKKSDTATASPSVVMAGRLILATLPIANLPRPRRSMTIWDERKGASMRRVAFLGLAACGFALAYILLIGVLVYANFVVFNPSGRRLDHWQTYLGLYATLYSPAAAAALLAAWYARVSPRGASVLLGVRL